MSLVKLKEAFDVRVCVEGERHLMFVCVERDKQALPLPERFNRESFPIKFIVTSFKYIIHSVKLIYII